MIQTTGKNITVHKDAKTADIMSALISAVPGAAKNLNTFKNNHYKGSTQQYLKDIVNFLRKNVTYKKDGFINQNIKFPGRLLNDKNGDCKSLSLFAAGALTAAGIKNGFRFVSYKPEGEPTHVYNYYQDDRGQKIFFDLCIKDLTQTNFLTSQDMNVNYLSEPEIGRGKVKKFFSNVKTKVKNTVENVKDKVQDTVQNVKDKRGGGGGKKPFKRVALAPARGAMLRLVGNNFRNLAVKLQMAEKEKPGSVRAFYNRVGGDYSKLQKAIKRGANKQPFLGEGEDGADAGLKPAEVAQVVGAASGILAPLLNFLKQILGKRAEDKDLEKSESLKNAPLLGEGFKVEDAEPGTEAASSGGSGGSGSFDLGSLFKNPLVLVGGAGLIYALTKK